ncbi:MAG: hypothetical protein JXN64_01485 [Spirochaetes bacterium]|nr:hypothetical protein [Spirochaetota bacterium]
MKKNSIAAVIFLLTAVAFLSYAVPATAKKSSEKIFSGRIIYITDNYVELKKGKTEVIVHFTDNTKYISMGRKHVTKNFLNVCQYVEAYYTDGIKKFLNKIIVKKESDCIK